MPPGVSSGYVPSSVAVSAARAVKASLVPKLAAEATAAVAANAATNVALLTGISRASSDRLDELDRIDRFAVAVLSPARRARVVRSMPLERTRSVRRNILSFHVRSRVSVDGVLIFYAL